MNGYIFFDADLGERFLAFAAGRGVAGSMRTDPMGGHVVELPDDLPDEIEEAIEDEYERLMDEQRDLVEAEEGNDARDLMGVSVALPDGRTCVVRLPADYARRLVEHFSFEEIQELVAVIARGVLQPVDGPLCRSA